METERHADRAGNPHRRSETDAPFAWDVGRAPIFESPATHDRPIPDLPICLACATELEDPSSRRFQYAFTSCSACGPRRSILEHGPLVRPNTSMAAYPMCAACREEYEATAGRRFHDEAASCPTCGPSLRALTTRGLTIGSTDPIRLAAGAILDELTIAIRDERRDSFCCDATSPVAVSRLRSRCGVFDVPLAVIVRDLDEASRVAELTAKEKSLLTSVERPVVLVSIRTDSPLTGEVAAGNRLAGLLLPYTPLHHLLLKESGRPLVIFPAGVPDAPPRLSEPALLEMAELLLIADRSRLSDRTPFFSNDVEPRESTESKHIRLIHHAYMAACLGENGETGTALGVVFDFGGLGADDTMWGGEIFRGSVDGVERLAIFRPIVLAGEHVSTKQIWRVALAMLDEVWSGEPPLHAIPLFRTMPRRGIEVVRRVLEAGPTIRSHAIGLQLEALAAIVLGRLDSPHPGALAAEWDALADAQERGRYPVVIRDGVDPWEIDFRPVIKCAVSDFLDGTKPPSIAARVRNSIIAAVTEVLLAHGGDRLPVAVTGDFFEGSTIGEALAAALGPGAKVLRPRSLPAGDRAIAFGQAVVTDALMRRSGAAAADRSRSAARCEL